MRALLLLSDTYPLCTDFGARPFLRRGARYTYLGTNPRPKLQHVTTSVSGEPIVALNGSASALYHQLCHPDAKSSAKGTGTGSGGSNCIFKSEVVLDTNLACDGLECDVETVVVVELRDGLRTVYFEFVHPACTTLTFTQGPTQRLMKGRTCGLCDPTFTCELPEKNIIGGAACCNSPIGAPTFPSAVMCLHPKQTMSFAMAKAHCATRGKYVCHGFKRMDGTCRYAGGNFIHQWMWLGETCAANQVQVDSTGLVTYVQPSSNDPAHATDSGNLFNVRWAGGRFPTVEQGSCSSFCTVLDDTCLCDVTVNVSAVFTDPTAVPSAEEISSQLHVGSPLPDSFDDGTYVQCVTSACLAAASEVTVFVLASSSSNGGAREPQLFDDHTIFRIAVNQTRVLHLRNMASTVVIGASSSSAAASSHAPAFSFRNPPKFLKFAQPSARDAHFETVSLLEHLFHHTNVAPFIATRLIQRFVSSNPSPRYVLAVSNAFATGRAGSQRFSEKYGDLGAALAATLLDREARSTTLDADPTHGVLREPLLKLLHLMRSLKFAPKDGREIELTKLTTATGMQAYHSPTVFSFFLPEYEPDGAVASAGLVSPESQIATAPFLIGSLNGMSSLIRFGLTTCDEGFGSMEQGRRGCSAGKVSARALSDGELTYDGSVTAHGIPRSTDQIVADLDLILTSGRLHPANRALIREKYDAKLAQTGSKNEAMRIAQELFTLAPEFHTTTANSLRPSARWHGASSSSLGRPYKAVVYLNLQGGCDSFNVLVPHSNCVNASGGPHDLFAEYQAVRGPVIALEKDTLRTIDASGSNQVCGTFGVHPVYQTVHQLYTQAQPEAAFIANIGPLVEPTSKQAYSRHRQKGGVRVPPGLFAHNVQGKVVLAVHAQETKRAKGVLGRMLQELTKDSPSGQIRKFSTASYSTSGSTKILDGAPVRPYMLPSNGEVLEFRRREALRAEVANLTATESGSVFAESYAEILESSIADTVSLNAALTRPLSQSYSGPVATQLKQVAKIIQAQRNGLLSSEREFFYVSLGAFDTHNSPLSDGKLGQVETGLAPFVAEMKAIGMWDKVTVVVGSEFGRTLTSNGKGTDHGWGGHTFVMGGQIKGGVIHGQYPRTLGSNHELSAGRGRVIPTTSWESLWNAVGQWLGLEDASLHKILPNLKNFQGCAGPGCGVLTAQDMYR